MRKYDLITRYLNGKKNTGKASRLSLHDETIIGYGWAVYCMRFNGKHLLFGDGYATKGNNVGWAGYSGQTTQHMQEIKGMLEENGEDYTVVDYRLEKSELDNLDESDILDIVLENQVESQGTGYIRTMARP